MTKVRYFNFFKKKPTPRNIRNNNPGNIRKGSRWRGLVGDDGQFCRFENMAMGYRALFVLLKTYYKRGWLKSPSVFVKHYCPAADGSNDEAVYAKRVSIAWADEGIVLPRVLALHITAVEGGYYPPFIEEHYADDIERGYILAGSPKFEY